MEVVTWPFMYNFIGDSVDNLNAMYTEAVSMFSRVNPFHFSDAIGGLAAYTNLGDMLIGITNIVSGIAMQLCLLFFLLEFFRKSMDLQWVKWENVFLFLLKLIFAKVVIQNSMQIMEWIYTVFNDLALSVDTELSLTGGGFLPVPSKTEEPTRFSCCRLFLTDEEIEFYRDDGGFWGLSRLLKIIELMPSIWIAQGVMLITGIIIFARVFEVIVYTTVAPIPLSSFSSEEHRQIGISFIKGYAAVCLQALMIVVMFAAFAALGNELNNLQGSYASGSWGILLRVILLGMGVFKSGSWAKKLCGAM